jgi:acyl-coenzyme A thioesterase PaaI-like protein
MTAMSQVNFDTCDERVAQGVVAAHDDGEGLSGWLGIRLVEMSPGGLRAVIVVRPDLVTPFGNLHGGVLRRAV